jgi:putative transposase
MGEWVFAAPAPNNRLWVADLTYVWTRTGSCYTAFVVDAFSRRIVHFWSTRRLHSACGDVPSAEFETDRHQGLQATTAAA